MKGTAMATTTARLSREYPCPVRLRDKGEVTLRRMTADDPERIVAFARTLPEEDLLFLRLDITNPAVVGRWPAEEATGRSVTLLAEAEGALAGYGRLVYAETTWQRHLGEIRLQVSPRYRGQGLGRALAVEIYRIASDLGLRKLIAQMTADQKGAMATFERLGFQPEALMQDFVIDRSDRTRDLVVMGYDLEGLTDRVD
jgi:GNAT superfamily N-acetyltransferase